jgi:hypothetical protein
MENLMLINISKDRIGKRPFIIVVSAFSSHDLNSVHPKTPNFGFTLSAIRTQLSAKSNYNFGPTER